MQRLQELQPANTFSAPDHARVFRTGRCGAAIKRTTPRWGRRSLKRRPCPAMQPHTRVQVALWGSSLAALALLLGLGIFWRRWSPISWRCSWFFAVRIWRHRCMPGATRVWHATAPIYLGTLLLLNYGCLAGCWLRAPPYWRPTHVGAARGSMVDALWRAPSTPSKTPCTGG